MLKKCYILLFMFSIHSVCAQVEFKAIVNKNKIGLNERLKVEFEINKQGADDFKAPSFVNFNILAGPSRNVSGTWVNGKSTYSLKYIYYLEPKKEGNFTIGSAEIMYDGKIIKSNPVKIRVTKEIEIPKDPNDPRNIAAKNLHIIAEVSNTKPYVGEGIYVVYKLYVSEKIDLNDWRLTESPEYNGFWNQDIEVKEINVRRAKFKGEDYRYIILKRAVLIPQRDGNLIIEPIQMDFSVGVPTGQRDFFGNVLTKNVRYSAKSAARSVKVKGLPEVGKPLDFTGAVGDFEFTVGANKNVLKANDAAQIQVKVTGKGNLKLFEIPKITTPPELEVYTPEHKEQVTTSLNGLKGTISDSYTVVPQYKGKYKIPEVTFSYFDPKEEKYTTIKSAPIVVDVTEGKELPATASNVEKTAPKRNLVESSNNFRYIALKTSFNSKIKSDFFKSNEFYLLLLLPFVAIPVGVVIGRRKAKRAGDIFGNRIRKADKLARKYLSEAKKQLGKAESFYIALEKALHNFLKARLHVETSDISRERISEILAEKGVDAVTITELIDVLNDCDFARYTPTTGTMMKQEYEKAKKVITKLDRHL